ncbi:ATP-binding protein [Arcicella rigui]|uniref:ATP-binding protein n=1 Tax=Arcicella rigui TaxID=797020 RepID=A0ABU5QC12_9BACT|nr:ATP-binding protein [Arcicella rigui]MEA5140385.1 ATP-binding protein [Arcicella rigui]
MKVKELYIKSYNQFEDFRLDLTYPLGHPKAGKPLDKVCFIGQSGTGKTSLLELINNFSFYLYYLCNEPYESVDFGEKIKVDEGTEIKYYSPENDLIINIGSIENYSAKILSINSDKLKPIFKADFSKSSNVTFFFPADFQHHKMVDKPNYVYDNLYPVFLDFSYNDYSSVWLNINKQIISYREHQIQHSLAISEVTQKIGVKSEDILDAAKKYQEWEQNNPNPLQELADKFLDKLLNRFNLRIRSRLDFEKIEDVKTIKVETLDGQEVPYDFQSTGTRQILLSVLPLYTLKPNKATIFFDEPERSLYPDIQKEIVELYTSLTTDCQFFYATHSPIIASSFEPWEIVELKFNPETGKVFQELYYEGERHVDNYTINPQYLRWDDILQRVFDLDSEGNEKRVKALMKLATLESKLKKNSIPLEEREKLWEEYLKLSKLTGWTTRFNYEKN